MPNKVKSLGKEQSEKPPIINNLKVEVPLLGFFGVTAAVDLTSAWKSALAYSVIQTARMARGRYLEHKKNLVDVEAGKAPLIGEARHFPPVRGEELARVVAVGGASTLLALGGIVAPFRVLTEASSGNRSSDMSEIPLTDSSPSADRLDVTPVKTDCAIYTPIPDANPSNAEAYDDGVRFVQEVMIAYGTYDYEPDGDFGQFSMDGWAEIETVATNLGIVAARDFVNGFSPAPAGN
jgi:hypothetical protein